MDKWARRIWERRKGWLKQRTAVVLCVVLILQILLPGAAVRGIRAFGADTDYKKIELKDKGTPEGAFTDIIMNVSRSVIGGNSLSVKFDFNLDDDWLHEERISLNVLSEQDFDDGDDQKANQDFTDYDSYLDGFIEKYHPNYELPSFSFTVNKDVLDVSAVKTAFDGVPIVVEGDSVPIGFWQASEDGEFLRLGAKLTGRIFKYIGIKGGGSFNLFLKELYSSDAESDVKGNDPGAGADVIITIKGDKLSTATDSNYSMEKSYEQDTSDPSVINYMITVKASSSDAEANGSNTVATHSNTATASAPVIQKASDSELSAGIEKFEDDEEEEDDGGEIELINDLFDWLSLAPTTSHYVSTAVSTYSSENAEDNLLYGKTITDVIPDTLLLDSVRYSLDGNDWVEVIPDTSGNDKDNWKAYLEEHERVFSYQIGTEVKGASEFHLKLCTRMAESLWVKYANEGTLHAEFPNQAMLRDEEDGILAISNRVIPKIDWKPLLHKDGQAMDVDHSVYKWTIEADAHFSDNAHLYLVDVIEDAEHTHTYLATGSNAHPIELELGGTKKKMTARVLSWEEIEKVIEADSYNLADFRYNNLTTEKIQYLLKKISGSIDGEFDKVYLYSCPHDDSENAVTDQIMLVPLKEYLRKKVQLHYYTKVVPLGETGKLNYVINIQNEARALWNWDYGMGPGTNDSYGSATVHKKFSQKVDLVNKASGGFDEALQEQIWEFEINQSGNDVDELTITDRLAVESQSWSDELKQNGATITLTPYDRATGTPSTGESEQIILQYDVSGSLANSNWYRIEDVTVDGKKYSLLTVHLTSINRSHYYYKFQVRTKVQKWNYATPEVTLTNSADYSAVVNGQTYTGSASAKNVLRHVMIEKEAVPYQYGGRKTNYYDYQNNTVQWRIRINDEKMPIKNAVVTDALPTGTRFYASGSNAISSLKESGKFTGIRAFRGKKMEQGSVEGSSEKEEGTWTPASSEEDLAKGVVGYISFADENESSDSCRIKVTTENTTGDDGYNRGKLVFTFNPDELKYIYEFTFLTSLDENYRKEQIQSDRNNELINKAELDGTIEGNEVVAECQATVPANIRSVTKRGVYYQTGKAPDENENKNGMYHYLYYDGDNLTSMDVDAAYMNWTAYVNRTKFPMEGVTVSDALKDFMELVPASLNVSRIELNSDGTENAAVKSVAIVEHGKICSDTSEAVTEFSASEEGFSFKIGSELSTAVLKITFDTVMTDDADASEMTNELCVTGPANAWKDQTGNSKADGAAGFKLDHYTKARNMCYVQIRKVSEGLNLPLAGAKFELQKLTRTGTRDGSDLSNWTKSGTAKTRVSNSKGKVNFSFLIPGMLYKVTEQESPAGYINANREWYIAVPSETGTEKFPDGPSVILLKQGTGNSGRILKEDWPNSPYAKAAGNELKIRKTGKNAAPLANVTFDLLYQGKATAHTGKTNQNGELVFQGLDPLSNGSYYVLKETVPEGYKEPEGEIRVYVTASRAAESTSHEKDQYTVKVKLWKAGTGTEWNPDGDGYYEIVNEPASSGGESGGTSGGESGENGGGNQDGNAGGENNGGNTGGESGENGGGNHDGGTGSESGENGSGNSESENGGTSGGNTGTSSGGHGSSSGGSSPGGSSVGSNSAAGGSSSDGNSEKPEDVSALPGNPDVPQDPVPEPAENFVPVEKLPQIPILPDGRPDIKPGSSIEFRDPKDRDGEPLYRGIYDPSTDYSDILDPGDYLMVLMDGEVPLAQLLVTIDEDGIPLAALPKVGDSTHLEVLLLALFVSVAGLSILWLCKRKK